MLVFRDVFGCGCCGGVYDRSVVSVNCWAVEVWDRSSLFIAWNMAPSLCWIEVVSGMSNEMVNCTATTPWTI